MTYPLVQILVAFFGMAFAIVNFVLFGVIVRRYMTIIELQQKVNTMLKDALEQTAEQRDQLITILKTTEALTRDRS